MATTPITADVTRKGSPWNVPNTLTTMRLVLAVAVIVCVEFGWWWTALIAFSFAAATDWADGYYARKYGQITKLGRIFDPFVDKIIICGTYIALVAVPDSGINASLAVLVTGRELLVTSLRGMIEGAGGDFSARKLGKWKMVAQCAAAIMVLAGLAIPSLPSWWIGVRTVAVWSVVILTIWSGADYVMAAVHAMRSSASETDRRDG